ncbi:MAG: hypothetical protein SNJ50_05300, partial [Cyanobacteriota bacterium]
MAIAHFTYSGWFLKADRTNSKLNHYLTMNQLTGLQRGTPFDDSFEGKLKLELILNFATDEIAEASIVNALIETLDGDDTVVGEAHLVVLDYELNISIIKTLVTAIALKNSRVDFGSGDNSLTLKATTTDAVNASAYGIQFSSVKASDGNDTFTIIAESVANGRSFPLASSSLGVGLFHAELDAGNGDNSIVLVGKAVNQSWYYPTASGYGLLNGSIRTGAGKDTITIRGEAKIRNSRSSQSYGVKSGAIQAGDGDDEIDIAAIAEIVRTNPFDASNSALYGLSNGSVNTGSGNDLLTIAARIEGGAANSVTGYGITNSVINAGGGDDSISLITSLGRAIYSNAYGLIDGAILGEDGHDVITITVEASGFADFRSGQAIATSYGVWRGALQGGRGDDTILVSAVAKASSFPTPETLTYGLLQSSVVGGDGHDLILITSEIEASEGVSIPDNIVSSYGISHSQINGGEGDDQLTINAKATISMARPRATVYGVYQGEIWGGDGNDQITITSTLTGTGANSPQSLSYGVLEGRIGGGEGNDIITISATNTVQTASASGLTDVIEGYGVVNSSVHGGSGDDLITISGTTFAIQDALISGGSGDDTF